MKTDRKLLSTVLAFLYASIVQTLILEPSRLPAVKVGQLYSIPQSEVISQMAKQSAQNIQFLADSQIDTFVEETDYSMLPSDTGRPFWDTSIKYAQYFTIKGRKVIKNQIDCEHLSQITSLNPLPKFSTTIFRMLKYNNTTQKSANFFSIITERCKYQQACFLSKYSIMYASNFQSKDGMIFSFEQPYTNWQESLFVEEGGLLLMEVDLMNMMITFINKKTNDKRVITIRQEFRDQKIYISVSLRQQNSAVEIVG